MNRPPRKFWQIGADAQSAVPSQNAPTETAFDPSLKPPIRRQRFPLQSGQGLGPQSRIANEPGGPQTPIAAADVRAVFDSRPVNAFDFYWEDQWNDGFRATAAFTVPDGFTYVNRSIGVEIFTNSGSGSAGVMNEFGAMATMGIGVTTPKLVFLVDASPTPLFTQAGPSALRGVPLFNVLLTGITIPTFVVIPGGSTFSIFIPNFIDETFGNTFFDVHAFYSGVMLPSSGREAAFDVTNGEPLPVAMGGKP